MGIGCEGFRPGPGSLIENDDGSSGVEQPQNPTMLKRVAVRSIFDEPAMQLDQIRKSAPNSDPCQDSLSRDADPVGHMEVDYVGAGTAGADHEGGKTLDEVPGLPPERPAGPGREILDVEATPQGLRVEEVPGSCTHPSDAIRVGAHHHDTRHLACFPCHVTHRPQAVQRKSPVRTVLHPARTVYRSLRRHRQALDLLRLQLAPVQADRVEIGL